MKRIKFNNRKIIFAVIILLIGVAAFWDTEVPKIVVNNQTIEYDATLEYDDLFIATDNSSFGLDCSLMCEEEGIEIDEENKKVNFNDVGNYEIDILASDICSNETKNTLYVKVVDTQGPNIKSFNKNLDVGYGEEINLESTSDYLKIAVEDKSDYELTITNVAKTNNAENNETGYQLSETNNKIIFNDLGQYTLEFLAEDEYGNKSTGISNINVIDKTSPILESKKETFEISDSAKEFSFLSEITAIDEIDGNITKNIEFDDSKITYGQIGNYTLTATVSDNNGNITSQEFEVSVKDKTKPKISLSKSSFSLKTGSSSPDYADYVEASDGVDGDVTSKVVIDDSNVNYNRAGTYKVK